MTNKGNYSEEISIKIGRLNLIAGLIETEYKDCLDQSEATQKFVNVLDDFALAISKQLDETLLKITDNFPLKIKDVKLDTPVQYHTLVMMLEAIHDNVGRAKTDQ